MRNLFDKQNRSGEMVYIQPSTILLVILLIVLAIIVFLIYLELRSSGVWN